MGVDSRDGAARGLPINSARGFLTDGENLDELEPKYFGHVRKDLFADEPLHDRREGVGFLLYSGGANGPDDGGLTFGSKPEGDDIVLRVANKCGKQFPRN